MSSFSIREIGVLSGREIIGDALIKLPFLRALRAMYPQATIHWITTKDKTAYSGPLRETVHPLINKIHETPEWINRRGHPHIPNFDLLIDTRGRWILALQARWCLPHKIFIAPAFHYLLSDKRPPFMSQRPTSLINRLLQTIKLAAGSLPEVTNRLPIPLNLYEKTRRILPEGPIYVGFAPGAGNEIKKWPLENFEKVAQQQVRMKRIPVFILGPQEMDIYDHLLNTVPEALFPLQAYDVWGTHTLQIDHTLAIATCLSVAVTNDSGTGHMLAAVDCPLISLFGPTSASKLAPQVSLRKVICAQAFGSDKMATIPQESVVNAINHAIMLRQNH